eukprot:3023198-Lingulodinium_polyedra.AAC.1
MAGIHDLDAPKGQRGAIGIQVMKDHSKVWESPPQLEKDRYEELAGNFRAWCKWKNDSEIRQIAHSQSQATEDGRLTA